MDFPSKLHSNDMALTSEKVSHSFRGIQKMVSAEILVPTNALGSTGTSMFLWMSEEERGLIRG